MTKKTLICALAILVFSLFSGICFAADSGNSINLGNEIMQSIDKTENSMKNVVSGNVIRDTGNMVNNGMNNIKNGAEDLGNNVENGMNGMGDTVNNGVNRMENDNNNNNNYNTTRTTAEGTAMTNTMTTTTWMWIILVVAATIIFVAIWYYATQDNG